MAKSILPSATSPGVGTQETLGTCLDPDKFLQLLFEIRSAHVDFNSNENVSASVTISNLDLNSSGWKAQKFSLRSTLNSALNSKKTNDSYMVRSNGVVRISSRKTDVEPFVFLPAWER